MNKIDQTTFAPEGNCQSAVLAMLLNLPLSEVPNFFEGGGTEYDWWERYYLFLQSKGWWFVSFHRDDEIESRAKYGRGYYEVSGPSSRGVDHAVVYCNGALWHDPHPSREGLLSIREVRYYYPIHDAKVYEAET